MVASLDARRIGNAREYKLPRDFAPRNEQILGTSIPAADTAISRSRSGMNVRKYR